MYTAVPTSNITTVSSQFNERDIRDAVLKVVGIMMGTLMLSAGLFWLIWYVVLAYNQSHSNTKDHLTIENSLLLSFLAGTASRFSVLDPTGKIIAGPLLNAFPSFASNGSLALASVVVADLHLTRITPNSLVGTDVNSHSSTVKISNSGPLHHAVVQMDGTGKTNLGNVESDGTIYARGNFRTPLPPSPLVGIGLNGELVPVNFTIGAFSTVNLQQTLGVPTTGDFVVTGVCTAQGLKVPGLANAQLLKTDADGNLAMGPTYSKSSVADTLVMRQDDASIFASGLQVEHSIATSVLNIGSASLAPVYIKNSVGYASLDFTSGNSAMFRLASKDLEFTISSKSFSSSSTMGERVKINAGGVVVSGNFQAVQGDFDSLKVRSAIIGHILVIQLDKNQDFTKDYQYAIRGTALYNPKGIQLSYAGGFIPSNTIPYVVGLYSTALVPGLYRITYEAQMRLSGGSNARYDFHIRFPTASSVPRYCERELWLTHDWTEKDYVHITCYLRLTVAGHMIPYHRTIYTTVGGNILDGTLTVEMISNV